MRVGMFLLPPFWRVGRYALGRKSTYFAHRLASVSSYPRFPDTYRKYCSSSSSFAEMKDVQDKTLPRDGLRNPASLKEIDWKTFPKERIRNFAIVAHIDHGKTTLSSQMLLLTNTIGNEGRDSSVEGDEEGTGVGPKSGSSVTGSGVGSSSSMGLGGNSGGVAKNTGDPLYLDKLQVEKERGITVKAQTATMLYRRHGEIYVLNLIDTPGHVDFSYEVSRSLGACEGAVLLVDACKGVQAQTMANFFLAFEQDLYMLSAINKVDVPGAEIERVSAEMKSAFDFLDHDILRMSAKTGYGVEKLFDAIVDQVPPPAGPIDAPLRALLFDSWFDQHRGVICLVRIVDGQLVAGGRVRLLSSSSSYTVHTCGILHPEETPTERLSTGQVGYVVLGMRDRKEAQIGDTLCGAPSERGGSGGAAAAAATAAMQYKKDIAPLPGFATQKPMVYAGVYPADSGDLEDLKSAIERLTLNDPSVTVRRDSSGPLGPGFTLGFLGALHLDVFMQRLEQEHDANVVATAPTVPYKVTLQDGTEEVIHSAAAFPVAELIQSVEEPMVECRIVAQSELQHTISEMVRERRGLPLDVEHLGDKRLVLSYSMPMAEVIDSFNDQLKQVSAGYASLDYDEIGYEENDLVKLEVMLNQEPVPPLCTIVHRDAALAQARRLVRKLKEVVPRDLFQINIQACLGRKVLASQKLQAYRKDVTQKLYGGDVTRKMKLLQKQKAGKKRMRTFGKVKLSQEAIVNVLRK